MYNDLYLVHEDDFVQHICEKIALYAMVKQLTHSVSKLPSNRGSKPLTDLAEHFDAMAQDMFECWGFSDTLIRHADIETLAYITVAEDLIEPEEAGYCSYENACFVDCEKCEMCEGCDEDEDEPEIDEADEFASAMEALTTAFHNLFGHGVSLQITVD